MGVSSILSNGRSTKLQIFSFKSFTFLVNLFPVMISWLGLEVGSEVEQAVSLVILHR
jgi:hypothetical protein